MTYAELSSLVNLRAQQAYMQRQAAKKLKPSKRVAATCKADALFAACEVAGTILGEDIPDAEREERIKALFLHAICN